MGFLRKILARIKWFFRRIKNFIKEGKTKKRKDLEEKLGKMITEKKEKEKLSPRIVWKLTANKRWRPMALETFWGLNLSLEDVFFAADNISLEIPEAERKTIENDLWENYKKRDPTISSRLNIILKGPLIFRKPAWYDSVEEIKGGKLGKDLAKEVLRAVMNGIPELKIFEVRELRIAALEIFLELEPSSNELKNIIDSGWIYTLPNFARKVERMARETAEKEMAEKKIEAAQEKRITKILKQLDKLQ